MKRFVILLMLLAAVSPSLTGCFGKFALTRKVYDVNASVHDRYLRNVVTWAFLIVPVYWVSGVVDLFVFNTIEFWSGRNVISAGEKTFQYSKGGENFYVKAVKSGESITYTIDRYSGERYLDSLTFSSDPAGKSVTATYRQPGKVTNYAAHNLDRGLEGVAATLPRGPALTALYR
jgi:hypothetical protein